MARKPEDTDWRRIAGLYEALAALTASPVVEVNRAVAVGMAETPQAGLEVIEAVAGAPELSGYHLLPSVRGDLLAKVGRRDEAIVELGRAATMTQNAREREVLERRVAELRAGL